MRKIQSFYIYKFSTDRLKEKNYNIKNISLNEARRNTEVVSISDSQMIRSLYRLKGKEFSPYKLEKLLDEKSKISKRRNSIENRKKLSNIISEIDNVLFIPEIISVKISDKRHYQAIIKRGGINVNGKTYVPFIFSAGLIRRNSGLFIDMFIKNQMMEILDNGRDKNIEIIPAKYNSYLGLHNSSTLSVTFPRIAVVPDLIFKKEKRVEYGTYIKDGIDPLVEEKDVELEFNAFDGCGLVSPEMARQWSRDLDIDYVGSTFIIRSAWLKGMCVTMDFHKFADEVASVHIIKDIYGNDIDIRNIDVIVIPSMFKLYDSYKDTNDYLTNCRINNLGWGISRVNPKEEKSFCKTSYQFLQVLNLNKVQIESICQPTLSWLSEVSGGKIESTFLYALGEINDFSKGWMNRLDPLYQSLILENKLIEDNFLVNNLDKSLLKKKNNAKKGNLYLNGNYQAVIPDLVLYCKHIFGMELIPLLQEGEFYSNYWNNKNVSEVIGIRSPIVYQSEVIKLNLKYDEECLKWFEHVKSGIVFPANGIGLEFALIGGADGDGDSIATIDSKEMLAGRMGGLPVLYDTAKAPKYIINDTTENLLYEAHMKGFGTKVGFLTNVSSTYYSLISNYAKDSQEYNTILQRLKWGRASQGLELDRQKGLIIPPFPVHWTKYKKITNDMSSEEQEQHIYNNTLLAERRPFFFVYLYSHYMRRYKREQAIYNNISLTRFGLSFHEMVNLPEKTQEQEDIISRYNKKTYFIDNDSVMNVLCHYMEEQLRKITTNKTVISKNFDYTILLSNSFEKPVKKDIEKVFLLYKEYKSFKRNFRENHNEFEEGEYSSLEQIYHYINQKAYLAITNNSEELANMIVYCCYAVMGKQSKYFCWSVFGKEILQNIKNKKTDKFVRIPMPAENGKIDYLWKSYSNYLINIE